MLDSHQLFHATRSPDLNLTAFLLIPGPLGCGGDNLANRR